MTTQTINGNLQPPKPQFFDNNGDPLNGGKVYTYVVGTTTPKATYSNYNLATLNANPIVLDSAGRASIYGTGLFRMIVTDSLGNTIQDQVFGFPDITIPDATLSYASTKTANYTVVAGDLGKVIPVDGSGGAFTVSLTAGATLGTGFFCCIRKIDDSYNAVTIDPNGAETINGMSDFVLSAQYEDVWLAWNGSSFDILHYSPGTTLQNGVIIDFRNVSGVASVNFLTGFTTATKFRRLTWEWDGVYPATNAAQLRVRVSTDGSTFLSDGNYYIAGVDGTSNVVATGHADRTTTGFPVNSPQANAATAKAFGTLEMSEYSASDTAKRMMSSGSGYDGTDTTMYTQMGEYRGATLLSPILGIQFLYTTGNISAGKFTMKGWK